MENGVPSADTINRVFRLLNPAQFEAAFRDWIGGIVGAVEGLVAIDGKTIRGSADGRAGIHVVSVYATGSVIGLDVHPGIEAETAAMFSYGHFLGGTWFE